MDNNLLDEITEAVYEELQSIDEQAVGAGILLSIKGSIRRATNTAPITKAENPEERQKLIDKATETFKGLKKQLDSKQIEHDRFKDLGDEEKAAALKYLESRINLLAALIKAKPTEEDKVEKEVEQAEQKDKTPTDPKEIAKVEPSEEQLEAVFKILDLEKLKTAKDVLAFIKNSGLLPGKQQQNEIINPKMKKPREMAVFGLKALVMIMKKQYTNLPNGLSLLGSFVELSKNENFKKQIKEFIKEKLTKDEEFSKAIKSLIEKKKLDDDVIEYFDLTGAKPSDKTKGEESNPEEYDVSEEDRQELIDAYNNFKDEFYNKKFLKDQGALVKALVDVLNRIDKGEEREAALIGQKAQLPEVVSSAANIGKVRHPFVHEVGPGDKEEVKSGEVKAPRKDLDNIKADVRSFAQNLIGANKLINQLADAIEGGKKVAAVYKKQVTEVITKVQRHSSLLHADLTALIAQPEQKKEEPLQEDAMDDLVARTTKMQDVYNNTVTVLNKIVPRMVDNAKSVKYDELAKTVKESLKFLEEILDMFPSVKAFGGELGDMSKIKDQFDIARKELDFDVSNIQTLVKGGAVATTSIENLADRISKFSKELERIFGIDSEIGKEQKRAADAEDDAEKVSSVEKANSPFDLQKFYDRRLSINPTVKMRMGELTGDGGTDEKTIRTFLIHYVFLANAKEDNLNEVQKTAFAEIAGLDQDLVVRYYQKLKAAGKESISDFIEQADRTQLQKLISAVNDYMSKKTSVEIGTSLTLTKLINYDFDDPSGMGGAGKRFYGDLSDDQKAAFENFIKFLAPGSVNEVDAKNQQEMGQMLGITPEAYEKAFLKLSSAEQKHVANVLIDDSKLKLFVDVMKFKLGRSISPGKGRKEIDPTVKKWKGKPDLSKDFDPEGPKFKPGGLAPSPEKKSEPIRGAGGRAASKRMRTRPRSVSPGISGMGEEIARKLEPIVREIVRGNNG